jgi:hypothetical protein
MARKPAYKVLDRKVEAHRSNTDVMVTELAQQGEHKLRIVMRSNSYKQNMWARIERFDGTKWHTLYSIAGDAMKTREGLYYHVKQPAQGSDASPVNIADFAEDYSALRNRAELILF